MMEKRWDIPLEEWIEEREKPFWDDLEKARRWPTVRVFVALFLGVYAIPTFPRMSW